MKHLDIDIHEPGERVWTTTANGDLRFWVVGEDGVLVAPGHGPLAVLPPPPPRADAPVEDLGLSVRTYNLVKREGVDTVGGLIDLWDRLGREGLSDIRNFGTNSVDEVEGAVLAARLRDDLADLTVRALNGEV